MITKRSKLFIGIAVVIILIIILVITEWGDEKSDESIVRISPKYGDIKTFISTTGTVLPQNRLEIMPPINGRIDKILVSEGQRVKAGQILIWMSSMERAALVDAARAKGSSSVKYWEDAYKPIPLVAPISGNVIVRSVETGQTVNSTTPILVISDRLIVKADVDETDIGRVRLGQNSVIGLDAYPDVKVNGRVSHISYESKIVSNVTMYEVDILPDKVPDVFRSGMSANVDIIEQNKNGILLVPVEALRYENNKKYVLLIENGKDESVKKFVQTGISDEKNVEIVSGLNEKDIVILKTKIFIPSSETGNKRNPFQPFGGRKKSKNK